MKLRIIFEAVTRWGKKILKIASTNALDRKNKGETKEKTPYLIPLTLGFVLAVLITLMFPRGRSFQFSDLKEGDVYIGEEIIAPFSFPINKSPERYAKDVEEARLRVVPVFVRKDSISENQIRRLESFAEALQNIRELAPSDQSRMNSLTELLNLYNIIISDENLANLLKKNGTGKRISKTIPAKYPSLTENLLQIQRNLYAIGILDRKKDSISQGQGKISVRTGGVEMIEELDYYLDMNEIRGEVLLDKLRRYYPEDEQMVKVGYQIVTAFLIPNVLYDEKETQARTEEAIASVPLAKGMVLEKERIIDTHERVTKEILEKLHSLAEAKAEREQNEGGIRIIFPHIGKFLLVGFSLALLALFLRKVHFALLKEYKKLLLIALIILLVVFLSFLLSKFGLSEYFIPVTIGSMLLTIFFDIGIGFLGTIVLSIILGGLRGNEFNITIISIFVGSIAIHTVSRVRTRTWLVKSLLFIASAYIVSIAAMEFLRYTPLTKILEHWGYGIINGVISPILAYGLMVVLEYLFGITTDMTLLELSDLNRPVLRELTLKAPGTYYHSILVGNLSEAAAEAIGANSLLARVGAYYHDIGKIEKPGYFIENQTNGKNPHEKLTPNMSYLILLNHVKEGLEMAQRYGLPKEIQAFIEQHHGTSVMNYFYQKAVERNEGQDIDESDFRYPGPKPQSKEVGIVMLADAVEAAARSLKDPTVSRIKGLVNSIIRERFRESELDECPLTLRDLNKIRESFQNILIGMFHARIEYPDQEEIFFKKNDKKTRDKEKVIEPQN